MSLVKDTGGGGSQLRTNFFKCLEIIIVFVTTLTDDAAPLGFVSVACAWSKGPAIFIIQQ